MVSVVQVLLQSNRLIVASGLELARDLMTDLQAFDPDPPPAGQARHRNEDLVRAVALGAWWADRIQWYDDEPDDDDDFGGPRQSDIGGY